MYFLWHGVEGSSDFQLKGNWIRFNIECITLGRGRLPPLLQLVATHYRYIERYQRKVFPDAQ